MEPSIRLALKEIVEFFLYEKNLQTVKNYTFVKMCTFVVLKVE